MDFKSPRLKEEKGACPVSISLSPFLKEEKWACPVSVSLSLLEPVRNVPLPSRAQCPRGRLSLPFGDREAGGLLLLTPSPQ